MNILKLKYQLIHLFKWEYIYESSLLDVSDEDFADYNYLVIDQAVWQTKKIQVIDWVKEFIYKYSRFSVYVPSYLNNSGFPFFSISLHKNRSVCVEYTHRMTVIEAILLLKLIIKHKITNWNK